MSFQRPRRPDEGLVASRNATAIRALMITAGVLHTAAMIWALVEQRDWKVPQVVSFYAWTNPSDTNGCGENGNQCSLVPATHQLRTSLSLRGLCAAFHALSALFVLVQAVFWNNTVVTRIDGGVNYWRWIEYSISAPLMVIVLQSLCGSFDFPLQIALCMLTTVTMLCGLGVELVTRAQGKAIAFSRKKGVELPFDTDLSQVRVGLHIVGWLCQTGVWTCLFTLLSTSLDHSLDRAPGDIRTFVIAINVTLCVLFLSCGVIQFVSLFTTNRVWVEFAYVSLSLTSKTVLGVLLFVGVIFRDGSVRI
jgi:hypothetical protein